MIEPAKFYQYLQQRGIDTFYGVPDSLLKDICGYISDHAKPSNHIIAANEGNAMALAAGHYIATGKPSLVYMQNSGLGNAVNPLISLLDEDVYQIPALLLIGWRGEPGQLDEPQHLKQGKVTLPLLDALQMQYIVLSENYRQEISQAIEWMQTYSKPVALVVRKNYFSAYDFQPSPSRYVLTREGVLATILKHVEEDSFLVTTTGKTSREVYELRESFHQNHNKDFLMVGSMGHTASFALGVALANKKTVYCIDGDGSFLMHMGGMGIFAQYAPSNLHYIMINNGSHESVGGQPTIGFQLDYESLLKGLGFEHVGLIDSQEALEGALEEMKQVQKAALVVYVKEGSRSNLGRPKTTPAENKIDVMRFLEKGR